MSKQPRASADGPWYRGPSFLMFVFLLMVYVASALPFDASINTRMVNVLMIGVLYFGVRALTGGRRVLVSSIVLAVLFVLVSETLHALIDVGDYLWDSLVVLLFLAALLGITARVVMRREIVTPDKIFAAASAYLVMGVLFGMLFLVIEQMSPGSFTLADGDLESPMGALIHFSFTTLTTVGYGNISPVGPIARSLSDVEAVLSQLYLTVVVARLVSLEITQGSDFDSD